LYWNDVSVARRARWLLGKQRFFVALLFANPYTSLEPWAPVRQFFGESRRIPEVQAESLRRSRIPDIAVAGYVRSLSGVERIRLSLTYALQNAPRVVLVDDVFRMVVPEIWGQLFEEFDAQVGETRGLIVASRFWQALSVTRYLFVLYKGNVVEWGPRALVFSQPRHPYTQWLLEQNSYSRNNIAELPWTAPDVSLVDQHTLGPFEVTPGHWARWC
jgi:ABC-type glutathione transport system ATPase component